VELNATVTLSTETAGASIYYTTDGTTPTTDSALYTGPISLSALTFPVTIKAIAVKPEWLDSDVLTAGYTLAAWSTTPVPTASPPAGTVELNATVTLSTETAGASIYYTTDGTTPTTDSTLYTGPVSLSGLTFPVTIKAIAVKPEWLDSNVLTVEYTPCAAAAPAAYPAAGAIERDIPVTLSTETAGASIYYTADGTTPTTDSALYTGPVSLSGLTFPVTIKAIAVKSNWLDSNVLTAEYTERQPYPALHYDFTGSGDTVTDKAGSNHGTLAGGASLRSVGDYPYMYTGASGYVNMGEAAGAILTNQTDFTIAAYVNITADAALSGSGWFLWSFANMEEVTGSGYCLWFRGTDTQFTISKTGWSDESWVRTGTALQKGTWQHVMYRQEGVTGTIYINGNVVTTGTTAIAATELSGLLYNYIGRPCYNGDNYMKYTKYADFRIYPWAILPERIAELDITETVAALNAAEALRSAAPTAGITAVGKRAEIQKSAVFSLTSENDGTWRVYEAAQGGSVLGTVTAAYSAGTLTLTSTDSDLAAGVYYVSVEESGKAESERLALTVKEPLLFALSFGEGTTVAEKGVVTPNGSLAEMAYEDGKKGKAGVFPGGAANYLFIAGTGGGSLLGGLGEFTVSFWVKTSSANSWWFYAAPDTRTQTYQSEYYVGILADSSGSSLNCERYLSGRTNGSFSSSVTAGTWTHVVLVHRKESAEIYLNGESKGALSSARFIPDILGATPICYIGRANWGSGEGATGSIDEYKIHSYALDGGEVSALYTTDGGE
jgi:hypothetical protein